MTVPAPSHTAASSHMWLFEFIKIKQNENFKSLVTFLSKALGGPAWLVLLCGTTQNRTSPSSQRSTDSTVLDGLPTSDTNWCSESLGNFTLKEASELTLETEGVFESNLPSPFKKSVESSRWPRGTKEQHCPLHPPPSTSVS